MLEVDGLWKAYDSRPGAFSVRDVGFSVAKGEFFTLLGPSGCGKTTTLRSIAGLEAPDRGEIAIAGRVVFSARDRVLLPVAKRDIAMVFQSYAVWPHMTVAQNVAFPLEALGIRGAEAAARLDRALEMVGLAAFRDRPAPMLSGGQQQRVALARAVAKQASVLLLDEPLSNLDARLREQMRVELRDLQQRLGTTAIYVTHDQEEAMALSDRVAVMENGVIVECDTPENLYLRPRTAFAARFVGQADLLAARVAAREDARWWLDTPLGRIESRCVPDAAPGEMHLLIRPEHIEFADADGPNIVAGRVTRRVFSGRIVEYFVAVGEVTLRVQGTSRALLPPEGEVRLFLPPERCVVVAA